MKKPSKKTLTKPKQYRKLFLQAERLWKEIAKLRYGPECQVKKFYPKIKINHSSILQIDHVISRRDKNLFFHVFNGIPVCSTCNRAKCFNQKGIAHAIEQIVINKIGGEEFGLMMELHQTGAPNTNWKKLFWIEQVVENLRFYRDKLNVDSTIDQGG